jgi:hypothetical protein
MPSKIEQARARGASLVRVAFHAKGQRRKVSPHAPRVQAEFRWCRLAERIDGRLIKALGLDYAPAVLDAAPSEAAWPA